MFRDPASMHMFMLRLSLGLVLVLRLSYYITCRAAAMARQSHVHVPSPPGLSLPVANYTDPSGSAGWYGTLPCLLGSPPQAVYERPAETCPPQTINQKARPNIQPLAAMPKRAPLVHQQVTGIEARAAVYVGDSAGWPACNSAAACECGCFCGS